MSYFSTVKPAFRLGPSQQIASDTTIVGYQEVSPKVVPGFDKPIKTHQVWASILWSFEKNNTNISVNHSGLMVFDPLQIILSPDGFSLSYIDLTVSAGSLIAYTLGSSPITTLYTPGSDGQNMTLHGSDPKGLWEGFLAPFPFGAADIKISVPGLTSPQSLVESYGDWHVTAVLGNVSDPVIDGHYLRMTMVQGSPYIYCEKKGFSDHVNIQTVTNSKIWYENKNMVVFTLPNDNQTYAVFGPPGSGFNYSFTDPINRLFSGAISLHFSDNAEEQYFSVAALPYQLIGNLIYARPEVGFANNFQSDGLTLFEIPFRIPGTTQTSITTNLVSMFFGQFGGIIKGALSDTVTFPPSTLGSDFYKALYDFTNPGSSDYPLFQAIQLFEQHAFAFPVDTKIYWEYNQSDAQVSSAYNITTSLKYAGPGVTVSHYSSDTLVALKPHQYKYLKNSDHLLGPNHVYTSARGQLHLMQGRSFETVYDYTGFVPSFPDVFNSSEKDQLKTYFGLISDSFIAGNPALENPPAAIDAAQGTYATGKVLGRFAQMMPALTMTDQSDLKVEIIGYMRAVLTNWFDPADEIIDIEPATPPGKLIDAVQSLQSASDTSVRYFYYDQKWDTLIGYPADFGAGMELNDHHFHYGYFIHAMAYILLYGDASDQVWALSHKPIVDMMIKDCANWDRSDSMFPFLRFFNAFNGHFYASGWALGSGNQESTAEAMNFAAGTLLWGYLTGDTAIKDLGIFLYTSQKITLQEYWFDIHQTNFPKDIFFEDTSNGIFNRYDYNRQIVSVLKSAGGEFATFFGAQPVFIYGIQYLPITHASVYLGLMPQKLLAIDNDLLPATQNFLNQGIAYDSGQPNPTINFSAYYKLWSWADIFAEVRALYNPEQAAIDLAEMGQYLTELFIPTIFLSDFSVSPVPLLLRSAVSPPFSDMPLGEAGESKAHTYYWIHGLKHLGVIQTELVVNIEMAVAFGPAQDDPEHFLVYQQTPNSRTVTFRHLFSGQKYCFAISDGPKLYHFTKSNLLSDCTILCPNKILPDDFTITQGQIVTLGDSAASNSSYLWTEGNYFLGSVSDFPVQVKPLVTTAYTLKVLSKTNADCVSYATTTIHVIPPSAPILQLSAPQVVCFSDVFTIDFQLSDGDSLPVHYKLSGGLQSDFIGLGTTNAPISVARQAANFQTNLNYTLFILVSDVVPQSDRRSFSVFVRNCIDSDTFVCPAVSLGSDPVINRGAQVTLGDRAVSDVLYTWYLDSEHAVLISSDFPLTVRPMATTTYYMVSQSTVRSYCNDVESITVHVKPCQLRIEGLTYPATICKSDLITINFKVNGNNLYTNQIGYTVVGDGVSDVSGFSTTGSLISVTRQAPALATTLNYTVTAYIYDLIECSDRMIFQVNVAECIYNPIKSSIFKEFLIFIFIYSFSFILIYITCLAYNSFF